MTLDEVDAPLTRAELLPGAVDQYLVTRVPICAPTDSTASVRAALLGGSYDCADHVAVCSDGTSEGRLVGLIPVHRVLAAPNGVRADELMDPDPPVVAPGADHEQAAWRATESGGGALAVVNGHGEFRGLVPPARLLGAVLHSYDEDFARLGGYLSTSASARPAVREPVPQRLWHRLPWLLVGLLGSALSAWLVGGFESQLTEEVRLAFFVPGVVYLADAVGTQTEALVIRGLAVGASLREALRLEVLTGAALGLVLAALAYPAVWGVMDSRPLATAVAVALFAACSVATIVAVALPWLLVVLGKDPAYGSGPVCTVVQDLLSLVIYLSVGAALVT